MKKATTFFIFYFAFLMLNIISCTTCNCQKNANYTVKGFEANTYSIDYSETGFQFSDITNNQVIFNKYSVAIEALKEIHASNFNFSVASSLYACDCIAPIYTTQSKLTNITITTNNYFDASHDAGSDISAYFNIGIDNLDFQTYSIGNYLTLNEKFPELFILILNEAPTENITISFTINISLDNATITNYEFTTDQLLILKE